VIVDLAHLADVPALDPRTWSSHAAPGVAPVAVALDILDEDHSLRLAMRRLAVDADLRETLGAAARAYWTREHSQDAMLTDYRRVLALASSRPPPRPDLPAHLRGDESGLVERLLDHVGVAIPWSKI
jgi:hypothetical protein